MVGRSSLNFGFSMELFPKRVLLWPEALCRLPYKLARTMRNSMVRASPSGKR